MTIVNPAMTPLNTPPAAGSGAALPDGGVPPGVEEYIKNHFPMHKNRTLAAPPHLDAFYQGLRALPLRSPKAGDNAQAVKKAEAENRKIIYDYADKFDAGTGARIYPKMIDRGMALKLSGELLEKDIGVGRQEKAALGKAVRSAFAAVSGLDSMSMSAFYLSMMLDPDGNYTLEDGL